MSTRADALTAVLNAARALRAGCPLTGVFEHAPVRPFLEQLYSAIDAVDTVDEAEQAHVRSVFCSAPECWRYADLPTGTCHHHSAFAALPSTRVMRAPVFEGGEAE